MNICKNCGYQNTGNTKFCLRCGTVFDNPVSSSNMNTDPYRTVQPQVKQNTPNSTPTNVQAKKPKGNKIWKLWTVIFMAISVIFIIIIFGVIVGWFNGGSSNKLATSVKYAGETTNTTTEKETITTTKEETTATTESENVKKLQTQICKDLVSVGIDETVAINVLDIINEIDLPVWDNKDSIILEDADKSDFLFSFNTSDGDFSVTYIFHVLNGDIVEIVDKNVDVIYNLEGLNPDYIFLKDIDLIGLIDYSKEVVDSVLKAPSTAEYPGSWLDPYEGWSFDKSKNILEISSYVDSQNSYGAMIRSNYIFRFEYTEEKILDPIYFNFDGKVLVNKQ